MSFKLLLFLSFYFVLFMSFNDRRCVVGLSPRGRHALWLWNVGLVAPRHVGS